MTKSASVIATETIRASCTLNAQARPAQTARKPERVRLRTHAAVAKAVRPKAAALSQPAATSGSGPNSSPAPASASGKSGANP